MRGMAEAPQEAAPVVILNAPQLAEQLQEDATYYRVQLGNFSNRAAAEERARQVAQAGFPVIVMEK